MPGEVFASSHDTVPGRNYRMCFRVVAMGDKNEVPFAQECHEEMLRRNACLQKEETLRYGASLPLGRVIQGAFVDDLIVAGVVARDRAACTPWHARVPALPIWVST